MKLWKRNLLAWLVGGCIGYYAGQILRYLPNLRSWCAVSVCGRDITPVVGGLLVAVAVAVVAWYWLE